MNNKVKIRITGKNPEYIIKEIIKRNINIYNQEIYNKYIDIIILEKDYKQLKKLKTTYKIEIINYYGIIKYQKLLYNNLFFIILIIIGIIINILLSNIVFQIEVIHHNKKIVKQVLKDLDKLGLKKYHFKVDYQTKNKIKEKLLKKDKEWIEWLEIEEVGTKYLIKIEERKENKKENNCKARNIISKKTAIIKKIEAEDGEVIKKENDYVVKGDTIISGLIYNKDTIVSKKCAKGKVYGESWYKVKVIIPSTKKVQITSTKKNYNFHLIYFKYQKNLFKTPRDYIKKEYNIIDSFIIPLRIGISSYQKINITKEKISVNTIDNRAIKLATTKLNRKLQKEDSIILKKVLKKNVKNSKIEVEVFFKVIENITDYYDISNLNIEEMNKKEE